MPASIVSELAKVLKEAKTQKHAAEERRLAVERLAKIERNLHGFFRSMRSAANFLTERNVSELDRELISEEMLRACLSGGAPGLVALGNDGDKLNVRHFQHFLSSIIDFASLSESIETIMLEHDKRQYRDVLIWNYCLDGVFSIWIDTLGRSIENSFEKPDGPHREEGEPISPGARFLAECMMVIDAPAYRHERLMRLLDSYRKDQLGRPSRSGM